VPKKNVPAQYPGLFLFSNAARLMRPVINLATQKIELIGTFEQVYMEICVNPQEAYEGVNIFYFYICMYNFLNLYVMLQFC